MPENREATESEDEEGAFGLLAGVFGLLSDREIARQRLAGEMGVLKAELELLSPAGDDDENEKKLGQGRQRVA